MPNTPNIPNYPPQGIQATLDLLYLYNPDVANDLISQLQQDLISLGDLKEQIEKALQDLQGVLRYKGSVETAADLPTEGNVIGDVWNIISTDENVSWDGANWDKFGVAVDLSAYATTANVETIRTDLQAEIDTNAGKTAELDADLTEGLKTKVDIGQGTENAGKTLVVGEDGNVTLGEAGTTGDYLPITGGTLHGTLTIYGQTSSAAGSGTLLQLGREVNGVPQSTKTFTMDYLGNLIYDGNILLAGKLNPYTTGVSDLGINTQKWRTLYVTKLNNGADLIVPTTGGTLARLEDIPEGGMAVVTHDNTLSGDGTAESPLSVNTTTLGAASAPAGTYSEYGVKGDYCATYAVIKTPNGRPYIKSGATNTIIIPAGMVLDCPLSGIPTDESRGLITIGSQQEVEIEETTDCYLVYVQALGEFRACNTLCFTPVQPEDGSEPCKMWFDGAHWQFKSDDTGNVWRNTRAHPVAKCIFTGGVLTRLNFIGWYDLVPETQ